MGTNNKENNIIYNTYADVLCEAALPLFSYDVNEHENQLSMLSLFSGAVGHFANDILQHGCMDKSKICICCSKCTEIMRKPGGTPGCVIRDGKVYLPIYKQLCGGNK